MWIKPFTSTSDFVVDVLKDLARQPNGYPTELQIDVSTDSASLVDLFTIGRLFAFLHELRQRNGITSCFSFKVGRRGERLENLDALGFFSYCDHLGISYRFDQPRLFDAPPQPVRPIDRHNYWRCILPLTWRTVKRPPNENDASLIVQEFLRELASIITGSLDDLQIPAKDLGVELTRTLFTAFRELISNCIMHSSSPELLVAMTIQRNTDKGQPIRHHGWTHHGEDRYEILVMDLGDGVLATVLRTLGQSPPHPDYHTASLDVSRYQRTRIQEESLLSNIFRGNLVIRKGRRSEGLYEVGRTLSWFDGVLNFFSGRTELQLHSSNADDLVATISLPLKRAYYLPGTIAVLRLPSHRLKLSLLVRNSHPDHSSSHPKAIMKAFSRIPRGFFGGITIGHIRRRSELDTHFLLAEDAAAGPPNAGYVCLWEINLKQSENIDVTYFDSLVQELCKHGITEAAHGRDLLQRIVFTNVPRRIINRLGTRNCISFLMLHRTYCLLLDETDTPHIIGAPRLSGSFVDASEVLYAIYLLGSLTSARLKAEYSFADERLDFLQAYLGADEGQAARGILGYFNGSFTAIGVQQLLDKERRGHLLDLDRCITPVASDACVGLLNGTCVDIIHDFAQFWSDNTRLLDCAKLLYGQSGLSVVDNIICFVNNGHRLAATIQRLARIPHLHVFETTGESRWEGLEGPADAILVLDALYPGDEDGYVGKLISRLPQLNVRLSEVLALCDYRHVASSHFVIGKIKTKVVSIALPPTLRRPSVVQPTYTQQVVPSFTQLSLASRALSPSPPDQSSSDKWRAFKYSPIELSTEFWQNVSTLELLGPEPRRPEQRHLMFYENNQRLLTHPRLRRTVGEFVAEFVRSTVKLKIDVILHPNHVVGSYLAQLVFAQLNSPPIVIALPQRRYGGRISLSLDQYRDHLNDLQEMRQRVGRPLRAVILDDSILSGMSIFTMLGLARKLDLNIVGCLALFSRITPEIGIAIEEYGFPFAYLYRLHMHVLPEHETPNARLEAMNRRIREGGVSFFARIACDSLDGAKNHLSWLTDSRYLKGELNYPCSVDPPKEAVSGYVDVGPLRQILFGLMLHPDGAVLDLDSRTAIAYNFLEVLVEEPVFWAVLVGLYDASKEHGIDCGGLLLLRRLIFILGCSRYCDKPSVKDRFESLCIKVATAILAAPRRQQDVPLFVEICLCLGVLGSTRIFQLLEKAVPRVGGTFDLKWATPSAVVRLADGESSVDLGDPYLTVKMMLGGLAWAATALAISKLPHVHQLIEQYTFPAAKSYLHSDPETSLAVIDILAQLLFHAPRLRQALGLATWQLEDEAIEYLAGIIQAIPGGDGFDLLTLGYSGLLRLVLTICKADTVLLYTRNTADPQFLLTAYQSRSGARPADALTIADLGQSALPKRVQQRMNDKLFCTGEDVETLSVVNKCSSRSSHLWYLGAPLQAVAHSMSTIEYYIVMAYRYRASDIRCDAYHYWIKLEQLLRVIFPRVHQRYIESSGALNAMCQAIRPVHAISDHFIEDQRIRDRRHALKFALSSHDIGDLIRRTVRMGTEPIFTVRSILSRLESRVAVFRQGLRFALDRDDTKCAALYGDKLRDRPLIAVRTDPRTREEDSRHYSIRLTVLELLWIETVCNALAYYDTRAWARLAVLPGKSASEGSLLVEVFNDIAGGDAGRRLPRAGKGLYACQAAARAAGGEFVSGVDPESLLWRSRITLPMVALPSQLAHLLIMS